MPRLLGRAVTALLLLAQSADLALWSLQPSGESNILRLLPVPAVPLVKTAGVVLVIAGAAVLARRGYPVAGRAVLLVGAVVGALGALSEVMA